MYEELCAATFRAQGIYIYVWLCVLGLGGGFDFVLYNTRFLGIVGLKGSNSV